MMERISVDAALDFSVCQVRAKFRHTMSVDVRTALLGVFSIFVLVTKSSWIETRLQGVPSTSHDMPLSCFPVLNRVQRSGT